MEASTKAAPLKKAAVQARTRQLNDTIMTIYCPLKIDTAMIELKILRKNTHCKNI
jgi:hypothetical protein